MSGGDTSFEAKPVLNPSALPVAYAAAIAQRRGRPYSKDRPASEGSALQDTPYVFGVRTVGPFCAPISQANSQPQMGPDCAPITKRGEGCELLRTTDSRLGPNSWRLTRAVCD